jgi:hypothetical protein
VDGEGIPASIRRILDSEGIFIPDGLNEDQREVFEWALNGHCMTCRNELGPATMLLVIQQGVVGVYCQAMCMSDMQVIGWLGQQHQDLTERIQFRGDIDADEAEEEEDE